MRACALLGTFSKSPKVLLLRCPLQLDHDMLGAPVRAILLRKRAAFTGGKHGSAAILVRNGSTFIRLVGRLGLLSGRLRRTTASLGRHRRSCGRSCGRSCQLSRWLGGLNGLDRLLSLLDRLLGFNRLIGHSKQGKLSLACRRSEDMIGKTKGSEGVLNGERVHFCLEREGEVISNL